MFLTRPDGLDQIVTILTFQHISNAEQENIKTNSNADKVFVWSQRTELSQIENLSITEFFQTAKRCELLSKNCDCKKNPTRLSGNK